MQERGRKREGKEQPVQEFLRKIEALQKEREGFVTDLRRREPRYAAMAYPQPYKAQELPLKPGEVLIEYALGEKESYIFRVEPGGKTQIFRLALGQEALERRLGAMLAPFRKSVLRREDLSRFGGKRRGLLISRSSGPSAVRGESRHPADHRAGWRPGGLSLRGLGGEGGAGLG